MPLTPSFSVSQNSGTKSIITAVDTSTGADVTVTKRRIFLLQADGTYLKPTGVTTDYIDWALASSSINLNVLTQNTALQITVQWLNVSNTVVYTVATAFGFAAYGDEFYYNLTQLQQANPNIIAANTYYYYKMVLRVELDSAAQAISFAGDINSAQQCFFRANKIIDNQSYFF